MSPENTYGILYGGYQWHARHCGGEPERVYVTNGVRRACGCSACAMNQRWTMRLDSCETSGARVSELWWLAKKRTVDEYGGRIGPFCKYPFTPSKLGCFCRFASNWVCFSLIKPVASADSVHSSAASRLRARWLLQTRFKAPLLLAYKLSVYSGLAYFQSWLLLSYELSLYSGLAYFQTWLLLAYSARQACYYMVAIDCRLECHGL